MSKKVKELSCTTNKIIITSYKADLEIRTEVNVAAFQPHGNRPFYPKLLDLFIMSKLGFIL